MGIWKWGFLGFLCAVFISTIDAAELRRNQPTERISGGSSWIFWDRFMLWFIWCCVFMVILNVSFIKICLGLGWGWLWYLLLVILRIHIFNCQACWLRYFDCDYNFDRAFCCDLGIGFLFDTVPKFLSITNLEGRHE